jgi:parallel beta-helix repeat protein
VLLAGANASLRGVTVDGNGATGRAVDVSHATNVGTLIQDVKVVGLGANSLGIEIWGEHHGVTVQDSTIEGGAIASKGIHDWLGSNASTDTGVYRTSINGFKDFGILFHSWVNNAPAPGERAIAIRNTITSIQNGATDNGTNEAGIWLGGRNNVAFGNTIDGTGWEGVWTGGDHSRPIVHSNVIRNTKMAGIYLEHSSDDARIENNSITQTGTGVNVEWTYGGVGTQRVAVRNNEIVGVRIGIFLDTGSHDSIVAGNAILDSSESAIRLQGVLRTVVRDNDLRDRKTAATQAYCVRETTGMLDRGGNLRADYSTVTGNDCRGSTRGVVAIDGGHTALSGNIWG